MYTERLYYLPYYTAPPILNLTLKLTLTVLTNHILNAIPNPNRLKTTI